jgi:hypothetical protein
MRVSIIRENGLVTKDGHTYTGLDVSALPPGVIAMQWYGLYGEVEYVEADRANTPLNSRIDELTAYAPLLEAWALADQTRLGALAEEHEVTAERLVMAARARRDGLLAESDWTQLSDLPQAVRDLWQPYRQALRDLPSQPGFPNEIAWPDTP